jgi:hypothetical protein
MKLKKIHKLCGNEIYFPIGAWEQNCDQTSSKQGSTKKKLEEFVKTKKLNFFSLTIYFCLFKKF